MTNENEAIAFTIATLNITRDDKEINKLFPAEKNHQDIDFICLQECDYDSRPTRVETMQKNGFSLWAATRGATRGKDENQHTICLESYLRKESEINRSSDGWRPSNITHEITFDLNNLGDRREMALTSNLVIAGRELFIINLHLPVKLGPKSFAESQDWHWKFCLPELGRWYSDKEIIIAGDWNFDAAAAFGGQDVVGIAPPQHFTQKHGHSTPVIGLDLCFNTNNEETHLFGKGTQCRVDSIAYRAPSYPQILGGLKYSSYNALGPTLVTSHHKAVVASFK